MRDAPLAGMRLKQSLLVSLVVITVPSACERNKTVKTTPAPPPPPIEARAEPDLETDLNTIEEAPPPEPRPEPMPDETGIDGDRPAPNVEAGPEEPPTMPPR